MIIRQAKPTDAQNLKTLYFDFLTHFPPKEEQDMNQWASLLAKFEQDENMYLFVVEEDGKVVSTVQMAIVETGSNKESTLNFYRRNGFAIDEKHSCLKRL